MEACGLLAGRLGKAEESENWLRKSKKLLDDMISLFWNGEKFICLLDGTHEVVDEESIAVYQPIILGKRLPKEIIDKIADTVGDPEKFFTPNGFASESQQSEYYDVTTGAFMLGRILAPVQLMMTLGLYNAGRKDVALKNAVNWCDQMQNTGPETVVQSPPQKRPPKETGAKPVFPTGRRVPGSFCSWGAVVYLLIGALLGNEESERSGR
jgi:neutral trehalase